MQVSARRSIAIIAGLLTVLVLGTGALVVAIQNGTVRIARADAGPATALATAPAMPGSNGNGDGPFAQSPGTAVTPAEVQDELDEYRQKLDEAYKALNEAYGQIRALQSVGPNVAFAREDRSDHVGEDDRHQRRPGRRESHER
jgi:hypothetical protein